MMNAQSEEQDPPEFVEVDPTGRYGRYSEILGKGSSKIVYRAFDEYEGIEVAWNQVKLYDFLQSPEELERLYCEIHLLKTLKHKNIMKFYTSWVDTSNRNINFVTEMFTSGTLRQYRHKHRRVNMRAVKNWCRQILSGLLYLHSHDPPVIHRDLKCDNIFINGNQGQVKIGDLGLAAILRNSHADHCVGTPEFMAPEVYKEQYNELVDIYSFGMCILEMVTFEYPYSECTHPAQIYKKVISGTKPDALYKVQYPEVRQFVEKCLVSVSQRLPAIELLKDPFLQVDDASPSARDDVVCELGPILKQPSISPHVNNGFLMANGFTDVSLENEWEDESFETTKNGIELFDNHENDHLPNTDITIKGKRKDDGSIHLKLRISDKEGRRRNIHFGFNIEIDTALGVATEMVAELDIDDFDVMSIAEMIDGEVSTLVPEWKTGPGFEELPGFTTPTICHNCASAVSSYGSLSEILSGKNHGGGNLQGLQCSRFGCMHGRFAEVTYKLMGSEQHPLEGLPLPSSKSDDIGFGLQVRVDKHDLESEKIASPLKFEDTVDDDLDAKPLEHEVSEDSCCDSNSQQHVETSEPEYQHYTPKGADDYETEIQQELRWLKAKYQIELRGYEDQCMEGTASSRSIAYDPKHLHASDVDMLKALNLQEVSPHILVNRMEPLRLNVSNKVLGVVSHNVGSQTQGVHGQVADDNVSESVYTRKNFCSCNNLPCCLPRTKSLHVDAIDT